MEFPAHLKNHDTSPFVWLETASVDPAGPNKIVPIGGGDHFCEWTMTQV